MDDATLLARWQDGDTDAGSDLFEQHFSTVFRFFRSKISGPVDDLVQRTFMACLEGRERIEGGGFRPYLLGVARIVLYAEYRSRKKFDDDHDVGASSVMDLDPTPSQVAAKREEHRLLLKALRRLSLNHQIALELYYVEGMRGPALATALGLPEGTVRSRLKRGLEHLRREIAQLAETPALAQSTVDGLETWAGDVRAVLAAPS